MSPLPSADQAHAHLADTGPSSYNVPTAPYEVAPLSEAHAPLVDAAAAAPSAVATLSESVAPLSVTVAPLTDSAVAVVVVSLHALAPLSDGMRPSGHLEHATCSVLTLDDRIESVTLILSTAQHPAEHA